MSRLYHEVRELIGVAERERERRERAASLDVDLRVDVGSEPRGDE